MLSWFKRKKRQDPRALLERALGGFELPTFPAVASQVLGLLRKPDTSLADIGARLAEDPHLTTKVLSLANSSAFALRHPVQNVSHAVSLLGRSSVESIVLAVVVKRTLPAPKVAGYDAREFWRTASRRAQTALALADILHPSTRSESFTASLLSDMAVPLICRAHPDTYKGVLEQWRSQGHGLAELEQDALGFDHASISAWAAERWAFPDALTNAIGSHHDGVENDGSIPVAVGLVAEFSEGEGERDAAFLIDTVHARHGIPTDRIATALTAAFEAADDMAARLS